MYKLLRQALFTLPPEKAHHVSMNGLKQLCKLNFSKKIISNYCGYHNTSLQKNIFGLNFKNPVGLGAGFDKNALYLNELATLGFGFVEIGTVTPKPQSGNDTPRLFRLPKDGALINRMGFNNNGVQAAKQNLYNWKNNNPNSNLIVGANIGKNKITSNADAYKDYEICFTELFDCADYFVINVSSPNTPGLRELQEKDALKKIISSVQNINYGKQKPKPILLKIAPDLTNTQLNDIVTLSFETKLSGLVATNTTIDRQHLSTNANTINAIGLGGLSGKPLAKKSTDIVHYLCTQLQHKIPVIASGGIFDGKDAIEKINAGASLIQVWTGFIYKGPTIAKNICTALQTQKHPSL